MSERAIELLQQVYARWGEGDLVGDVFHPEVEVVWADGMLDSSVDKGVEAFGRSVRQYTDVVEEPRVVAEEIHPLPRGAVVFAEFRGKGKESGVPTATPVTHVWEFEGDKAVRVEGHFGHLRDLLPGG